MNLFERRSAGVLLHPTSLPGPKVGGDLGPEAYRFVDFLAFAGQRWWQMLPLVPPDEFGSPYQAASTFASSPYLIHLKGVDPSTKQHKLEALLLEFERLGRAGKAAVERFVAANRGWLPDYALFRALRIEYKNAPWTSWDPRLRKRDPATLSKAHKAFDRRIQFFYFLQSRFAEQWSALRGYAAKRDVRLIGDLPIYVSHDSADVWANPGIFQLDDLGRPLAVAGVPPDYFSKTGQLWGNPLYDWKALRRRGYDWWIARLRRAFDLFDAVRLDHFIGFSRYYRIPAGDRTAEHGTYVPGPGAHFFETVQRKLRHPAIIAEDLGNVTPEVIALRDQCEFPGLRVLQFAFSDVEDSKVHQPHNYPRNCVVYTGTHDNDTTVGWFKSSREHQRRILAYLGGSGREVHWEMIRLAYSSVAQTAIIPAQDLLGLDTSARMNFPGRADGNWSWRLKTGQLNRTVASRLGELTRIYARSKTSTSAAVVART